MPAAVTTLRVLVDAPPDAGRTAEWALFDSANRVLRGGRDRPSAWPPAERREAVIVANRGRLAVVTLPPLPPPRVGAAARFALEDQLAGAPEDSHVAQAAQAADGSVRTAIVADAWMREFATASKRCGIEWQRALLESDLAIAPAGTWRWCAASTSLPGFVRTDRGATVAVGAARDDAPPAELALALSGAGERAPRNVRVDAAGASATLLTNARVQTRVEFTAGAPWRWSEASPAAFTGAIDLLTGSYGPVPRGQNVDRAKLLRPALWIAVIAIGIEICAGFGEWVWLRWQGASVERELDALARSAVPSYATGATQGLGPAAALWARERDLRHAAGLAARDDFLPLLARASPALGKLSPGAVRAFGYGDGHLTIELQKTDPAQTTSVQQDLQRSGLVAIAAPTPSGARLRVGFN